MIAIRIIGRTKWLQGDDGMTLACKAGRRRAAAPHHARAAARKPRDDWQIVLPNYYEKESSYGFNGGNLVTNLSLLGLAVSQFGIAGRTISFIRNPVNTILLAEASAFEPFSWHQPKRPLCAENSRFNDARNLVSFVDGHASYIKIFWADTSTTSRVSLAAAFLNPPPGYDYQWSGD